MIESKGRIIEPIEIPIAPVEILDPKDFIIQYKILRILEIKNKFKKNFISFYVYCHIPQIGASLWLVPYSYIFPFQPLYT